MAGPQIVPENIRNKINELEAERLHWIEARERASGVKRKLAQTALTQIEARLRWYRARVDGKKPVEAFRKPGRRATRTLNRSKLDAARA